MCSGLQSKNESDLCLQEAKQVKIGDSRIKKSFIQDKEQNFLFAQQTRHVPFIKIVIQDKATCDQPKIIAKYSSAITRDVQTVIHTKAIYTYTTEEQK